MFGKVLLCRLARCIIESDDLVRVSIVFRARSYQLNRANASFFPLPFILCQEFRCYFASQVSKKVSKGGKGERTKFSRFANAQQRAACVDDKFMHWRTRFFLSFSPFLNLAS